MPLSKESVEDTATPAEHGPLYLVDVGAPVFGLRWGWGRGLRKRSPPLLVEGLLGGECGQGAAHLAEGELAVAGAVLRVPDEHLPIVLDPALATEDVVNAGCHLIPLKVVPKPARERAGRVRGSWLALGNKCYPDPGNVSLIGAGHMGLGKEPRCAGSSSWPFHEG